jgi:phenylpropionate dioxygenase-like ring-hydroxylating dioxygenase large terminal subunit
MRREVQIDIIERLLDQRSSPLELRESRVEVERYRSSERLVAERQVLFREYPLPIAHESEVAEPGDYLTHDTAGTPILVVRLASGELRAFANVCRHRGARLASDACGHGAKAFVCRYHGWAYGLDGELLHIPGQEMFPSLDSGLLGLIPLPISCAHGMIWVMPRPGGRAPALDLDAYLGELGHDMASYSMASHHLYRKSVAVTESNWKLVIDAFLEGYHARSLHRHSISRFFADAQPCFDIFPPHIRSVGARKNLAAMAQTPRESWNIRDCATPFYCIFPCSILVVHPDFLSLVTVFPQSVDRTFYTHYMLIPGPPSSDEDHDHWQRSYQLIEETVFQSEDLMITESVQKGLDSGAYEHFLLGGLEYPIRVFHDRVDEALALRSTAAPISWK